jgi:hypothetical protein
VNPTLVQTICSASIQLKMFRFTTSQACHSVRTCGLNTFVSQPSVLKVKFVRRLSQLRTLSVCVAASCDVLISANTTIYKKYTDDLGSNPTRGMDVYVYIRLLYVCVVLCR